MISDVINQGTPPWSSGPGRRDLISETSVRVRQGVFDIELKKTGNLREWGLKTDEIITSILKAHAGFRGDGIESGRMHPAQQERAFVDWLSSPN